MLVDVHTHITDKRFDEDRGELIEKSKCSVIINNGISVKDNRETLALAKKHKKVKAALGLHPYDIVKMSDDEIEKELTFISKQKIIALGEIGLDFTYENKEKQIKYFKKFLDLAKKMDLPVITHSRKAEKELIDILEEFEMKKVILHCYCGKKKLALRAEKLGYYFSVPPRLLSSDQFQELVKEISITKLLTETDAPYMGAKKGERNIPSNVEQTIKKIAELKRMDETEVKNSIFMNYQSLF
jgi:TatD DNase family protein